MTLIIPDDLRSHSSFPEVKTYLDKIHEIYQNINIDSYSFIFNSFVPQYYRGLIEFRSSSCKFFRASVVCSSNGHFSVSTDLPETPIFGIAPVDILRMITTKFNIIINMQNITGTMESKYLLINIFDDDLTETSDRIRKQVASIIHGNDIRHEHDQKFEQHIIESVGEDLDKYGNIPIDILMDAVNIFVIKNTHGA